MAKLWKRYTDELYTGLNYLASWPPSGRAEVGDVATFQDRSLERYVSIGELGIETTTLTGTAVCERGWASAETNVINPSVAGAAPLQPGLDAGAELTIQFGAEHAILMRAERTREESPDPPGRTRGASRSPKLLSRYARRAAGATVASACPRRGTIRRGSGWSCDFPLGPPPNCAGASESPCARRRTVGCCST